MNKASQPIITIDRSGCNGPCPIYSAEVYADGTVIYKGVLFVKVHGEKQFSISQEKVAELIAAFKAVRYRSLKPYYEAAVTCQPTTTTSFRLNIQRKTVANEGTGPPELDELEDMIDRLAELNALIGSRDTVFV